MTSKAAKLLISDLLVLAVSSSALAYFWDHGAYANFAAEKTASHSWVPILTYGLLAALTLAPKPKTKENTPAATPTKAEAKLMYMSTAVVDYLVVGFLFYVWNKGLATHGPGDKLCPFTATCHVFTLSQVLSLKDDIMCKGVWKRFTSRAKINAWPYSWPHFWNKVLQGHLVCSAVCVLVGAGLTEFPSISSPAVLLRVWAELVAGFWLTDMFGMEHLHRWMHEKKGWYFLHKDHHDSREDTTMTHKISLCDFLIEVPFGLFLLLGLKWLFGFDTKIHLLSLFLTFAMGLQVHSMNPYSVALFNPFLDHFFRGCMRHSVHHVMQNRKFSYICGKNYRWNWWTAEKRKADIRVYNKYMKTNFPEDI